MSCGLNEFIPPVPTPNSNVAQKCLDLRPSYEIVHEECDKIWVRWNGDGDPDVLEWHLGDWGTGPFPGNDIPVGQFYTIQVQVSTDPSELIMFSCVPPGNHTVVLVTKIGACGVTPGTPPTPPAVPGYYGCLICGTGWNPANGNNNGGVLVDTTSCCVKLFDYCNCLTGCDPACTLPEICLACQCTPDNDITGTNTQSGTVTTNCAPGSHVSSGQSPIVQPWTSTDTYGPFALSVIITNAAADGITITSVAQAQQYADDKAEQSNTSVGVPAAIAAAQISANSVCEPDVVINFVDSCNLGGYYMILPNIPSEVVAGGGFTNTLLNANSSITVIDDATIKIRWIKDVAYQLPVIAASAGILSGPVLISGNIYEWTLQATVGPITVTIPACTLENRVLTVATDTTCPGTTFIVTAAAGPAPINLGGNQYQFQHGQTAVVTPTYDACHAAPLIPPTISYTNGNAVMDQDKTANIHCRTIQYNVTLNCTNCAPSVSYTVTGTVVDPLTGLPKTYGTNIQCGNSFAVDCGDTINIVINPGSGYTTAPIAPALINAPAAIPVTCIKLVRVRWTKALDPLLSIFAVNAGGPNIPSDNTQQPNYFGWYTFQEGDTVNWSFTDGPCYTTSFDYTNPFIIPLGSPDITVVSTSAPITVNLNITDNCAVAGTTYLINGAGPYDGAGVFTVNCGDVITIQTNTPACYNIPILSVTDTVTLVNSTSVSGSITFTATHDNNIVIGACAQKQTQVNIAGCQVGADTYVAEFSTDGGGSWNGSGLYNCGDIINRLRLTPSSACLSFVGGSWTINGTPNQYASQVGPFPVAIPITNSPINITVVGCNKIKYQATINKCAGFNPTISAPLGSVVISDTSSAIIYELTCGDLVTLIPGPNTSCSAFTSFTSGDYTIIGNQFTVTGNGVIQQNCTPAPATTLVVNYPTADCKTDTVFSLWQNAALSGVPDSPSSQTAISETYTVPCGVNIYYKITGTCYNLSVVDPDNGSFNLTNPMATANVINVNVNKSMTISCPPVTKLYIDIPSGCDVNCAVNTLVKLRDETTGILQNPIANPGNCNMYFNVNKCHSYHFEIQSSSAIESVSFGGPISITNPVATGTSSNTFVVPAFDTTLTMTCVQRPLFRINGTDLSCTAQGTTWELRDLSNVLVTGDIDAGVYDHQWQSGLIAGTQYKLCLNVAFPVPVYIGGIVNQTINPGTCSTYFVIPAGTTTLQQECLIPLIITGTSTCWPGEAGVDRVDVKTPGDVVISRIDDGIGFNTTWYLRPSQQYKVCVQPGSTMGSITLSAPIATNVASGTCYTFTAGAPGTTMNVTQTCNAYPPGTISWTTNSNCTNNVYGLCTPTVQITAIISGGTGLPVPPITLTNGQSLPVGTYTITLVESCPGTTATITGSTSITATVNSAQNTNIGQIDCNYTATQANMNITNNCACTTGTITIQITASVPDPSVVGLYWNIATNQWQMANPNTTLISFGVGTRSITAPNGATITVTTGGVTLCTDPTLS